MCVSFGANVAIAAPNAAGSHNQVTPVNSLNLGTPGATLVPFTQATAVPTLNFLTTPFGITGPTGVAFNFTTNGTQKGTSAPWVHSFTANWAPAVNYWAHASTTNWALNAATAFTQAQNSSTLNAAQLTAAPNWAFATVNRIENIAAPNWALYRSTVRAASFNPATREPYPGLSPTITANMAASVQHNLTIRNPAEMLFGLLLLLFATGIYASGRKRQAWAFDWGNAAGTATAG
jgi:hypothetical protein